MLLFLCLVSVQNLPCNEIEIERVRARQIEREALPLRRIAQSGLFFFVWRWFVSSPIWCFARFSAASRRATYSQWSTLSLPLTITKPDFYLSAPGPRDRPRPQVLARILFFLMPVLLDLKCSCCSNNSNSRNSSCSTSPVAHNIRGKLV